MAKENVSLFEGTIKECLQNTTFRVVLSDDREVLCHVAGKMRIHYVKILIGDKVRVEMTPYDQTKGRIVYRIG